MTTAEKRIAELAAIGVKATIVETADGVAVLIPFYDVARDTHGVRLEEVPAE